MLDPHRTASRPTKKKKRPSSPLTQAPVQSQDAKDAREWEELGLRRVVLHPPLSNPGVSGVLAVSPPPIDRILCDEVLGRVRKLGEPYEDGRQLHHAEEVGGQLLEAHGNPAVALDALEEVLDQTALLVEVEVELSRLFSAGSGRDDGYTVLRVSLVDDRVGVLNPREQRLGLGYVVDLSFGEVEMNRIAEGVDTSVNLRGRSSAGTPDGLRPRFFSAPAAS